MKCKLSDICSYVSGKVDVEKLNIYNYVSTENMLTNKNGKVVATSLPFIKQTQEYHKGDVLVFRANSDIDPRFLYYVLSDDIFFDYSMATSKGTKMPRGDRTAIMQYEVSDFKQEVQEKIAGILSDIDEKIEINKQINNNLSQTINRAKQRWDILYSYNIAY